MVTRERIKINRLLALVLLTIILGTLVLCVACTNEDSGEKVACKDHSFVRVEDELNKEPTYEKEGRELRKCSVCGVSASFVIPKLVRVSVSEDPNYMPLLESYVVHYGDTLEKVATMYFTSGWSFTLDKETKVGNVSESGYDFAVKYTPSADKYESLSTTIRLVVKKAVLKETDVHLKVEIDIPTSVTSLEQIEIGLLASQEIAGSVRWVENQEILRNQVAEYDYIFTPEDTDCYEIYFGKVRLRA